MVKRKTGPGELALDGKGRVRMRKCSPRTWTSDKEQQFLYVVDSGPMRVVIFDRQTMAQIGVIGMRGKASGEFDIVHHMAADSKGNLYTGEIVNNRRAQRFVLKK